MARKKNAAMVKIEPSVMRLVFTIPNNLPTHYIDLSQCVSIANRRFYRQGLNWAVSGFKYLTPQGVTGDISIAKLPTTWTMGNSWEKGFRAWQRMNSEALAEAPSVRPKFLDFKVFADELHHTLGKDLNLLPNNMFFQDATPGEWEMSKYIIPDNQNPGFSTEREIIATGASYPGTGGSGFNAVSLIEGYAASRGLPDILDPNTPDDALDASGPTPQNYLSALFNQGTSQDDTVLEDMITENNLAPYPFENDGVTTDTQYPGGANQMPGMQLHDFELVTTTTIGGTTRLMGGEFPCGLVRVTESLIGDDPEGYTWLFVDLVPGTHRGYLCEPMTEM